MAIEKTAGADPAEVRVPESGRLYFRELRQTDFDVLCSMLQDMDVMYAYEHAFSGSEVQEWLDRQIARYASYGFGLWAVILKETGEFAGQCGITMQDVDGIPVPEIGYLFRKAYWHKGYAAEAAVACKRFAFETLGFPEVYSIIRDTNIASQNVARRNGMSVVGNVVKHYYGMNMPHLVFRAERE